MAGKRVVGRDGCYIIIAELVVAHLVDVQASPGVGHHQAGVDDEEDKEEDLAHIGEVGKGGKGEFVK